VVGYGQTLIGIANTYGVELEDLYRHNNYNKDTVIYPKEWVIIQPADQTVTTETPSKDNSDSQSDAEAVSDTAIVPKKTARPLRPTRTQREAKATTSRPVVTIQPTPTPTAQPVTISEGSEPLVVGVVISAMLMLIGVVLYGLFNRN
jgi:hypothetical protein